MKVSKKIILLSLMGIFSLSGCVWGESSSFSSFDPSSKESSSFTENSSSNTSFSFSLPDFPIEVERYYEDVDWSLRGVSLMKSLTSTIRPHTQLSYKELWSAFWETDVREDGSLWDMYSDEKWTKTGQQCGNYKNEGDCYNREHSVPKSWFDDANPMYTDLHHIIPTDGYVNGKRSNFPLGEVGSATYTSKNGSKLGKSSDPAYTGTVFEPIDEYKGDFARIYFYFVTCYSSHNSWVNNQRQNITPTRSLGLTTWSQTMFVKWAKEDPVSQKEIDRNEAVYEIQGNRNPYVDNPSAIDWVFGE